MFNSVKCCKVGINEKGVCVDLVTWSITEQGLPSIHDFLKEGFSLTAGPLAPPLIPTPTPEVEVEWGSPLVSPGREFLLYCRWGPPCLKSPLAGLLLCSVSITGRVWWESDWLLRDTCSGLRKPTVWAPLLLSILKLTACFPSAYPLISFEPVQRGLPSKTGIFGTINTTVSTRAAFCKLLPANQIQLKMRFFTFVQLQNKTKSMWGGCMRPKSHNTIWPFTETKVC